MAAYTSPFNRPADASLFAERIEIDIAESRQNHSVLKLARHEIPSPGVSEGPRVLPGQQAGAPFGRASVHRFLGLTGLQVALDVPIERDDDMIGDRHLQAGFRLSAEDFPVRLSARIS